MGRQMYVYSNDGRKKKVKTNKSKDEVKKEDVVLPPLDSSQTKLVTSGTDSVVDKNSTPRSTSLSSYSPLDTESSVSSPPQVKYTQRYSGVLTEGVLTRRHTLMNGPNMYLPFIANKAQSMYSSRSDPGYSNFSRGRRLSYERNHTFDGSFLRNSHLRKEHPADKLVTFYRDFESSEPELRMVVSEHRFRGLNHLLDDIARLVDLRDHERSIHSPNAFIIRHISDFQDGAAYFFGPPYPFPNNEYHRFKRVHMANDFTDYDLAESSLAPKDRRKRQIRVSSSMDRSQNQPFLLDGTIHKSLYHVLHDICNVLLLNPSQVQNLWTRTGKPVQSIEEMYFSPEDHFVAVSWDDSYYNRGTAVDLSRSYGPDNLYRKGPTGQRWSQMEYHERGMLRPFEVNINNKQYVFDPPHMNYHDFRRFDAPPVEQMEIEWVYGYNGKNCRNNLHVIPTEEIVYFVARIVVIHAPNVRRQRYYTEHTEEIRCIAQHPNSWIFASGQVAGSLDSAMGHIRIWDSKSLITLNVLNLDQVDLSVECLAFSQGDNGVKLASISTSGQEWYLNVWYWEDGNLISRSDVYGEIELACMFDPADSRRLVSCGKSHVFFWNVSNKLATYVEGEFGNQHVPEFVTCLGFNMRNELITADSNAYLHVWDVVHKRTTSIIKTSHTGSIITMTTLADGFVITGGGSDRLLTLINYDHIIPTLSQVQIGKENGGIVAIAILRNGFIGPDAGNMSLVIGTSMNNVMIGSINSNFHAISTGTSDQMLAVASHPIESSFLTAGMDKKIRMWSANEHSFIWDMTIEEPCSAATFYPSGEVIALGTTNGRWLVITVSDSYELASFQCDRSQITCLSYSTNGNFIAVGSEAGAVFLYHCYDDGRSYRYISNIKSWAESIIAIDWSLNEVHLRFVTSSYNFEIWDVERYCEERNRNTVRNMQFDGETSPLSYYSAGVWNGTENGVVFKTSDKSKNNSLLVAGTGDGSVRLYNYPCESKLPLFHEMNLHSGSISHVSFLPSDRGFISSGEGDYCLVQWRFIYGDLSREEMMKHTYAYGGGWPMQRRMSKKSGASSARK